MGTSASFREREKAIHEILAVCAYKSIFSVSIFQFTI